MKLYESCKTSIRVAFFGFVLIGIGSFIQNPNVNLFYTFKSDLILFIGEFCLRLGELITMNLPLIFMLNGVCKKANNASPVVMALVGYFTYLVTTAIFSSQNLSNQAYAYGYDVNSFFSLGLLSRYPLETGMIGSLLVTIATRSAFIFSRHRGTYSLTNILSTDIAGIVYNVLFCFILGLFVSYTYPLIYLTIEKGISFISEDLMDPLRIAIFSVADRLLSMCGLANIIRNPFWYSAVGGSSQNINTGQAILGDVNIWSYAKDGLVSYIGSGRFITPYYIINMFMIPGIYIGTLFSMSDKKDRNATIFLFVCAIILSIVMGNPLPMELLMLFTSPALLFMYLLCVGGVSYLLVNRHIFLGFTPLTSNSSVAMPGNFADFIINLRDPNFNSTIIYLVIIGLVMFVVSVFITMFYYRVLAFDFANSGNGSKVINKIIKAVGGKDNIINCGSGLFKLTIYLNNPELILIDDIQELGTKRVFETREGIVFEFGTSSYAIAKRINKLLVRNRLKN